MRRGTWHQCGDRSQLIALEELKAGYGVGVVLSPRDLTLDNAADYSAQYRECGASVVLDHQYYLPGFSNSKMESYESSELRASITELQSVSTQQLSKLSQAIQNDNRRLASSAVIAPALIFEAGQPEILDLNSKLFGAAKAAGDALGIPTYATVAIGRSSAATEHLRQQTLSHATALESDGWYYAFEFTQSRIPEDIEEVVQCCQAGLLLACTSKPVMHAFAGPLGLLSPAFAATGIGVGHSQNLWHFNRSRWAPSPAQGGGGDAPPRFFSKALWGTIVYPDEIVRLDTELVSKIITHSEHSTVVTSSGTASWPRWDANKHFVRTIASTLDELSRLADPVECTNQAIATLRGAVALHADIRALGLTLSDRTNAYQAQWISALERLATSSARDYEYLALLR